MGSILIVLASCKEDELPLNPYDDIEYPDTTLVIDTLSDASFVKIHRDILSPSCNVLGCHDGSFEPDFRSIESAYATLVYHPIIKNNLDSDFVYRVVPGDTGLSVLHERLTNCCFVNQNDRMPQDNIGNALPQYKIDDIAAWINDGAKDITGAIPNEPDNLPNVLYYAVANATFDTTYSDNRNGGLFYNPFIMPKDTIVYMAVIVSDDKTYPGDLSVNMLKVSDDLYDFSNAQSFTATTFIAQFNAWILTINTSAFNPGQQYYFRYYINDNENPTDTEYPNNQTFFVYQSMWSFIMEQ